MKSIRTLLALAKSRERAAQFALGAAEQQHSSNLKVLDEQHRFFEQSVAEAQTHRRERIRKLLQAPTSRPQLALVSSQFQHIQEKIGDEADKLEQVRHVAAESRVVADEKAKQLRQHIAKRTKLETAQSRIEENERRATQYERDG